ncbi:hypothetical protein CAV_1113 [Campylobacter avium LMG 24591]|uniref:Uncharacterized protein n=1 Tax=Campylobacter avium LMG 24591 TaxID=522484 RepID=A0A222MYS5_9BACT|nr:hypothetical protein [Campylobacter avium]ASQ30746.1 hypothetical protein CAV_1113 [Campylobacter avium LMG 24591]OYD78557.1 hypothetical protein CAV8706_1110 [Campylobacter avium]
MQVETPTPSTHQLNGLELTDDNLFGANALSATDKDIIPQIQNNISESAITRMKQRIENLMQGKGFKGSTKQKSTDKKQDR